MKKKIASIGVGLIVCALCLTILPLAALSAEITLRLGHVAPPASSHDISSKKLAERMAVNTGGRVEIKVFGGSQLGNIQEHWAQLKSGAIHLFMHEVTSPFVVEPAPKNFMIGVFPYVFESQEHMKRFLQSDLHRKMMAKVEKSADVKYLGFMGDISPRGFSTTKRRVTTPDEIKGLKLRVPPFPPFVAAYKAWGAKPTPVAAKEIYTSVKSGIVEGMDLAIADLYSSKYYEIQKYFVAIEYMRSGTSCWMNGKKWQSLAEDIKTAFLKSAKETEAYCNEATAKQSIEAEEAMSKAGIEVVRPDLKPWMEIAEKEVRKNEGKIWENGLYDKIKAFK